MYNQGQFRVIENRPLTRHTMLMRLAGETSGFSAPGQFVNVAIPGFTLRRPISVADYDDTSLTLIYDIVGGGTTAMSEAAPGHTFDLLTALGNGFDTSRAGDSPVLLGGGVGAAPMLGLARTLREAGVNPTVILGFNSAERVIMPELFEDLCIPCHIATVDGSMGTKGFVTDVIREMDLHPSYFYGCGPMPMLRALCQNMDFDGEVSLEARMGCGFGACVCCSLETRSGSKRICKEGPVFRKEDLIWK